MKNATKIFQPLKKDDRMRCAYLGPDASCVVIYERETPLGRQEYAQIATRLPGVTVASYSNRSFQSNGKVSRIVLHDAGILAVPMALGRRIRIDVYEHNSSENLKSIGRTAQTLSIDVAGIGHYSISEIPSLMSGGFTIQSTDSDSSFARDVEPQTAEHLREQCREYWDLTRQTRVMRFEDPDAERLAAERSAALLETA